MQALRTAWLLDTQPRHLALAELASSLKGDDAAKWSAFADKALQKTDDDSDVTTDYDSAVSTLDILKTAGATRANDKVVLLVQSLALSCVFADVRCTAAASGLLTDAMALDILNDGRDDMRKAILKSRTAGLYDFAYSAQVERACDGVFDANKALYWKILLGADPVKLFQEDRRPSADTMLALARTLPLETLAMLLEKVDHIGHAKWLQIYIRRFEDKYPPQGDQLNEHINKLIERLLYNTNSVWISDDAAGANCSKIVKYLFRRWGPETTHATAALNSDLSPVISFADMLRLSKYTSWDQQLKTFLAVKDRLLDMKFDRRCLQLVQHLRRVNKSARSRHCQGLVRLVGAVTTSRQERLTLLEKMVDADKLPLIFTSQHLMETILPEPNKNLSKEQLSQVFDNVIKVMDSEPAPPEPIKEKEKKKQHEIKENATSAQKRGSLPFREYLPDGPRLDLFRVAMEHKQWQKSQTNAAIAKVFNAFINRCNSPEVLRSATNIIVNGLGDRCTATLLLPVVRKMTRLDKDVVANDTKNLPIELLQFLRRGGTTEAEVLLAAVKNRELTETFVTLYGRESWWRVLQYGLGGTVPSLGHTLDPPIKETLLDAEAEELDFIVVGEKENEEEDLEKDAVFEESFKDRCSGVDLFKRQEGLLNVLRYLKDDEFRLRRMRFVARQLLSEPENTKAKVVPGLMNAVWSVQDFVTLSSSLGPLWEKCKVSNLSLTHPFVKRAKETIHKVVSGALAPQAQGALLARSIVTTTEGSWVKDTLIQHASKLLIDRPAVLSFMVEAAANSSPNYSIDILSLTLRLAKTTELKPAELVAMQWAKSLQTGLGGESAAFVLHKALERLADQNVLDWNPVSATTLQRVVSSLSEMNPSHALELLRNRITTLLVHLRLIEKEHNDEEAETENAKATVSPDTVTAAIASSVDVMCQIIDKLPAVDYTSCLNVMFGQSLWWSTDLAEGHIISITNGFLKQAVFTTDADNMQKRSLQQLLRLFMDAATKTGCDTEQMIETLTKERQDIVPAIALCPQLALYFVQHRPALFRTVLEEFLTSRGNNIEEKDIESVVAEKATSTDKKSSLEMQLAVALLAPLKQTHLPAPTAKVLAQVLENDQDFAVTECLALLLREVNLVESLTKRILSLPDREVTVILRAAAVAGHPVRTVELCIGGSALKETAHRDVFDGAIADTPDSRARSIIEKVLKDPSTGPSLTKRMLRLSRNNRLQNPMGLMLVAFRDGKCHRDIKVFLIHTLALNRDGTQEMTAEQDKIHSVFDASKIPPKDLTYVASQVIEVMEKNSNWESPPLLRFFLKVLELCPHYDNQSITPASVYHFVLNRLCRAGVEDVFRDADSPVTMLATLLERAAYLRQSVLHGQQALARWWNGMQFMPLSSEAFGRCARQCRHETVQNLLHSMVLHLPEPHLQFNSVVSLWANALLRPEDNQNVVDSQVDFMITLANQVSQGGTYTNHFSSLSSIAVQRGQADDKQGGSDVIRCAAIRVVTWAKNAERQDSVDFLSADNIEDLDCVYTYVRHRVLLASRPGTPASELIAVFHRALQCDEVLTRELQKKDPSVKNTRGFLSEALSAARWTQALDHHFPLLEFLCDPAMRQHVEWAMDAIRHHAMCALHAKVEPDRVRTLLFPLHAKLPGFEDDLFSFSAGAAVAWVSGLVQAQERKANENRHGKSVARVKFFSDRVTRQAASVLASSTLPGYRLQSLRFLPETQVDVMAERDEDYHVRVVARALIAARDNV